MCGIIGVASRRALACREWLDAGCAAMAHRGPDDSGSWWSANGNVGLAQRRLAIIDLSPGGHQPMHYATNRLTIVFNGEIYNYLDLRDHLRSKGHKFATQSDTEVVLAAYSEWGTDCLSHLNGMFALALYDDERNGCSLPGIAQVKSRCSMRSGERNSVSPLSSRGSWQMAHLAARSIRRRSIAT
jgi:asparagine synthase (glutamine-hydrolysing)